MAIAVSSTGRELESRVDPRFGRCGYFLIVDDSGRLLQVIDNAINVNRSDGAGTQSAARLVEAKVQSILVGHCGPKAFQVLKKAGIQVFLGIEGTAAEALKSYRCGELKAADAADVDGRQF